MRLAERPSTETREVLPTVSRSTAEFAICPTQAQRMSATNLNSSFETLNLRNPRNLRISLLRNLP
jgi:hypothetical protein